MNDIKIHVFKLYPTGQKYLLELMFPKFATAKIATAKIAKDLIPQKSLLLAGTWCQKTTVNRANI